MIVIERIVIPLRYCLNRKTPSYCFQMVGNLRIMVIQIHFRHPHCFPAFRIYPFPTQRDGFYILQYLQTIPAFNQAHTRRWLLCAFHANFLFKMVRKQHISRKRRIQIRKILIFPFCLYPIGIVYYIILCDKWLCLFLLLHFLQFRKLISGKSDKTIQHSRMAVYHIIIVQVHASADIFSNRNTCGPFFCSSGKPPI